MTPKTHALAYLEETAQQPAPRTYLFTAGTCLLLDFMVMFGRGMELLAVFALLVALPGLLAQWSISPYIYLVVLGYNLFDPGLYAFYSNYSSGSQGRPGIPSIEPLLLAIGVAGYSVAQFRLLAFWKHAIPPRFRNKGEALLRGDGDLRRPLESAPESESFAFLFQFAILCFSAFATLVILYSAGVWLDQETEFPLERPLASFALFIAILVLSLLSLRLASSGFEVRKLTKLQAYLTLVDCYWRETRREGQRIERWRKWLRESGRETAP